MSIKLILMMNNKQKLTDSTVTLINKIRDKKLLNYITTYSREYPCWTYRNSFLSVIKHDKTNVITNHDDIIKYLEKEKHFANKKIIKNPLQSPSSLYFSNNLQFPYPFTF